MHPVNRFPVVMVALALALLCAAPAQGEVKGDVSVEMTARKVVRDAKGVERFESGASAKPGEVIEYVVVYRNNGRGKVTDLLGTIPVPAGMEYLPGTARPERFEASTDGRTFAPAPLKRLVRSPNGKEALREVPTREYRALRWDFRTLEAGAEKKAAARMRILNDASDNTK